MITVIGVDCATDPRKVGIAIGVSAGSGTRSTLLEAGTAPNPAQRIADLLPSDTQALIALDAPLGWPSRLGSTLKDHQAGGAIGPPRDEIFRRETDRFIRHAIGKQPLDVGADRIARTAHAALSLLTEVRALTREPIPLAWEPELTALVSAVEVYPAATLMAHGLPGSGYKRSEQRDVREKIVLGLSKLLDLPTDVTPALENPDVLDAIICVQAGLDFLSGNALPPADQETARKEGWIWVAAPEANFSSSR